MSVLALLLVTILPAAPAETPAALAANAGDSRLIPTGGAATVHGAAVGGTAPFTFAWSHSGSGARFADPAAAETTFDAAGLPNGPVDLTLTVTDAAGATATDTVRYLVAGTVETLTGPIGAGVPDELVISGLVDGSTVTRAFTIAPGTSLLVATLEWTDAANDLDFHLRDPSGAPQGGTAGATAAKPETVTISNPAPGEWTAVIEAYSSTPDTYALDLLRVLAPTFPVAYHGAGAIGDVFVFGHADPQRLQAIPLQGTIATAAWDLDADGLYDDATGLDVTAAFPVGGSYPVSLRVSDPDGFRSTMGTTLTVRGDAAHVRVLRCGGGAGGAQPSMEWFVQGTCWNHVGHHTYYLGGDAVSLAGGTARLTVVEQVYALPTSTDTGLRAPVTLEASLDGLTWFALGSARASILSIRQDVTVTAEANASAFRFVRAVVPKSVTQGLSGYLDDSWIVLAVNPAAAEPTKSAEALGTALTCEENILEDFFAEHPCTFGGVDRYDSPSAYHTYFLGTNAATLTSLAGTVNVAPWRSDDFFLDWESTSLSVATVPHPNATYAAGSLDVSVIVEVSANGITWTEVGTVPTTFGSEAAFNLTLETPTPARFVRFHAEEHPEYDNHVEDPALHHFRGFMLHSGVTVS